MTANASTEQTRPRRIVRIGAIQNQIVLPTDKPVIEQVGDRCLLKCKQYYMTPPW